MKKLKREISKHINNDIDIDLIEIADSHNHLRIYVRDNNTGLEYFVPYPKSSKSSAAYDKKKILRCMKSPKWRVKQHNNE